MVDEIDIILLDDYFFLKKILSDIRYNASLKMYIVWQYVQ